MADREKSALYPSYSIEECINFVRVISDLNSKMVAYSAVAEQYGLSSVTTKSFTQKIGSAKQYGLITTSNSTIQLTELARDILYPKTADTSDLYRECFRLPPLYSALIEKFNEKAIPNENNLANLLMSDYKISKVAKDLAAKVFIENATALGFINAGVFTFTTGKEEKQNPEAAGVAEESIINEHDIEPTEESRNVIHNIHNEAADYITQSYPVESGKIAKIIIPIDSSEDDLYAIRDLLDVILKRKFKISI